MTKINYQQIKQILTRGVEEIIDRQHLEKRLLSGERLRIKHGIDPTGPKIHLGRATQFWKLREFQELGHQIVLIIGDYTAQIGDASDKLATRRILSEKEVKENLKNYTQQIGKILNLKKTELHYNSEWHKKLSAKDLLNLAMKFTAQQMIQRRNFKERWEQGKEIGLHELTYPLFQGYDSVMVKADLEIGGSDQLFNLLAGRKIQEFFGQPVQDIITLKMLEGLDGQKMSTSWGNVVNIVDPPNEMYGKLMSMRDEMILPYFELCTKVPIEEIKKAEREMKQGANPRDFKAKLAFEIVKIYHGENAANEAEKGFEKVFKKREMPTEMQKSKVKSQKYRIIDLLVETKLTPSKSQARRLVEQGGVKIDGKVIDDWQKEIIVHQGMIVQVGPRRFVRLDI
ncbi:MAG: tyrosine--tRNA ligase [Patescibacteria group bacterium]